jgi:uncharacterized protein (TIGR02594 family)
MLPSRYGWLAREPGPKMLIKALKLYGTLETPGAKNNPTILAWAKEVGGEVSDVYKADSIPWCGLFMAVVAKRAGKDVPKHPLWALSWSAFGAAVPQPMLGDVLTFTRNGGGHVTLYVGEDGDAFHCLGGNQSDAVTITRMAKSRLYAARRPLYREQPANIRIVKLASNGAALSLNEA